MDNIYGKLSGIYELTLKERFSRVHMLNDLAEFPWLDEILSLKNTESIRKKKTTNAGKIEKMAKLSKFLYYSKEQHGVLRVKICGLRVYKKRLD